MVTLSNFLEIENNSDLLKFKLESVDISLWSLTRFSLLHNTIHDIYKIPLPYDPIKVEFRKIIPYIIKTIKYRSTKIKANDVLFFGSDLSNIKTNKGYFNRLSELIALELNLKIVLIEESSQFNYKRPRTFKRVFTYDDIVLKSKVKSFFYKLTKEDIQSIDLFIKFLKENYKYSFSDIFWDSFKNNLLRIAKETKLKLPLYENLLQKARPKFIFVEGASYGYGLVALIKAARNLNIKVIEYQHGLISLNHPAYNFADKLPESYHEYLPDLFLVFGDYWKENCRMPINTEVFGYPYLEYASCEIQDIPKIKQLLYVSNALLPEDCVARVLRLKKILLGTQFKLIFRPHPSEINRLSTVYKPLIEQGVEIDIKPLYNTLATSSVVVGEYSTVLFESIKFKCLPISFKSELTLININTDVIKTIDSIEEIPQLLHDTFNENSIDQFWSKNWKMVLKKILEDNQLLK